MSTIYLTTTFAHGMMQGGPDGSLIATRAQISRDEFISALKNSEFKNRIRYESVNDYVSDLLGMDLETYSGQKYSLIVGDVIYLIDVKIEHDSGKIVNPDRAEFYRYEIKPPID